MALGLYLLYVTPDMASAAELLKRINADEKRKGKKGKAASC